MGAVGSTFGAAGAGGLVIAILYLILGPGATVYNCRDWRSVNIATEREEGQRSAHRILIPSKVACRGTSASACSP